MQYSEVQYIPVTPNSIATKNRVITKFDKYPYQIALTSMYYKFPFNETDFIRNPVTTKIFIELIFFNYVTEINIWTQNAEHKLQHHRVGDRCHFNRFFYCLHFFLLSTYVFFFFFHYQVRFKMGTSQTENGRIMKGIFVFILGFFYRHYPF